MWLNEKEEKILMPFRNFVMSNLKSNLELQLNQNTIVTAVFDGEYESDNGLDSDDKNYEEYFAMLFKVVNVLKDDGNLISEKDIIEINYHNVPLKYKIGVW